MTVNSIREPERDLPVRGEYDVVVLGGGPAGIAAAASAAALGRKTLMVERYGFLGGMGTAAGVTTFCGLHANVHGEHRQVVHGIADELLARIDRLGGLNKPHVVVRQDPGAGLRHRGLQMRGRRSAARPWRRDPVPCARRRRRDGRATTPSAR